MAKSPKPLKEAVILDAVRTPIGKSGWKGMEKGGTLAHVSPLELSGIVIKESIKRSKVDPNELEDVILGVLSQIGEQGGNFARMSAFMADLPDSVCGVALNRYCGSGLQACNFAAMSVQTGNGDFVLGGGAESMSRYGMGSDMQAAAKAGFPFKIPSAIQRKGLVVQGVSADMIAKKYGFTRKQVDEFGLQSQQRAVKAWRAGAFKSQIVAVPVPKRADGAKPAAPAAPAKDLPQGGMIAALSGVPAQPEEKTNGVTMFTQDEGIRPECLDKPQEALAKMGTLPVRFQKDGVHTAANSSQITDGAAAVMFAAEEAAKSRGLKPRARVLSTALAGCEPVLMLLAIAPSMKKALQRAGLTMDDMDVIEINEAFASAVLAACRELDLDPTDERLNPVGGAIALGHPIGASGAVLLTKALHELERTKKDHAIISLCMGGGMGIATVIERI
ncbi:MAG: thiolase family protein [Halobacteria archaeon]